MKRTYYFIVESLTQAMRGNDLLNRAGIPAQIRRTPREFTKKGCGYCIVTFSEPERARRVLQQNSVKVLSVEER